MQTATHFGAVESTKFAKFMSAETISLKVYSTPILTTYGTIQSITAGGSKNSPETNNDKGQGKQKP